MAKLFMMLIGCSLPGRHTEQHDVFFSIGESIRDIIPHVMDFWPETKGKIHFDAWREVTNVDGFSVKVTEQGTTSVHQLFFINLGGYKKNEFEEFHYKMITVATDKSEAISKSKQTAFFKHTGFKGANAHIDDKYGVDVDDLHAIKDILPAAVKAHYSLLIEKSSEELTEDIIHLGYFRIDNVDKWLPV